MNPIMILPNKAATTYGWTNMQIEVDAVINIPGVIWDRLHGDTKEARREVFLQQDSFSWMVWDA